MVCCPLAVGQGRYNSGFKRKPDASIGLNIYIPFDLRRVLNIWVAAVLSLHHLSLDYRFWWELEIRLLQTRLAPVSVLLFSYPEAQTATWQVESIKGSMLGGYSGKQEGGLVLLSHHLRSMLKSRIRHKAASPADGLISMKERNNNNNNKQQVEEPDGHSLIQKRPDRKHLGPGPADGVAANQNKAAETEAVTKVNAAPCSSRTATSRVPRQPPSGKNKSLACRWYLPPAVTLMTVS